MSELTIKQLSDRYEHAERDAEWLHEVWNDISRFLEEHKNDPDAIRRIAGPAKQATQWLINNLASKLVLLTAVWSKIPNYKVNYLFGLLLVGHTSRDLVLQRQADRRLRGILLSIAFRNNWFPKDRDHWIGAVQEVLGEESAKHAGLSLAEILIRMAGNGFSYIYDAAKYRMIDQIRKDGRQPDEIAFEDIDVFDNLPGRQGDLGANLQRQAVIRRIGHLMPGASPWIGRVLTGFDAVLRNPELIEGETSERGVRAKFIKIISKDSTLSVQQIRDDVRRAEREKDSEPIFRELRQELRPARAHEMRIGLRRVENKSDEVSD